MARKCSHCGKIGHNSRTCTSFRGTCVRLRLFGVQIETSPPPPSCAFAMKKSLSIDSLPASSSSSSSLSNSSRITTDANSAERLCVEYLSDGHIDAAAAQDRRKGQYKNILHYFVAQLFCCSSINY